MKFSLVHIRKMQNIAEVEASKIDKMAPSTKGVVEKKRPDVDIKKI